MDQRDLAAEQDEQQRRVFRTLADAHPAQMTRAELETALALGRLDASDGLHPLVGSGTVHQRDDLIWPTRCAMEGLRPLRGLSRRRDFDQRQRHAT